MAARRKIPVEAGTAALAAWRRSYRPAGPEAEPGDARSEGGATPLSRTDLATAVRYTIEELGLAAPGRSVEVRVPPFAATQCVEGLTHKRGTPPAVVETDPQTWLELATGAVAWADALAAGRLRVSGQRADLSRWLPVG